MVVAAEQKVGKVVQVIGPVVDIEFAGGDLPAIYNAVRIVGEATQKIDVICEVEQHLGENRVRTVAMKPTDGMQRGMRAIDTGGAITMPVGAATLGRVMNVLGEPVDFPDRPVDPRSAGRFTVPRRRSKSSRPSCRCSRPASRSSTCSNRTCAAERSGSSAAPASARPSSSRS